MYKTKTKTVSGGVTFFTVWQDSVVDLLILNSSQRKTIIFSDKHETLMAVSGKDALNPGDKMAVTLDEGYSNKMGKIQGSVEAVTVQDIMDKIPAPSYVIKTDIQKYDCKVLFVDSCQT